MEISQNFVALSEYTYELYQRGKGSLVENNHRHSHPLQFEYRSKVASLENMNCQLNIYQTELYFRYVGHYIFDMKLLVDFWRFPMITKLILFWFPYQCRTILWLQQTRPGIKPEINKQCHDKWWLKYRNNRSVSWRLSCNWISFGTLESILQ